MVQLYKLALLSVCYVHIRRSIYLQFILYNMRTALFLWYLQVFIILYDCPCSPWLLHWQRGNSKTTVVPVYNHEEYRWNRPVPDHKKKKKKMREYFWDVLNTSIHQQWLQGGARIYQHDYQQHDGWWSLIQSEPKKALLFLMISMYHAISYQICIYFCFTLRVCELHISLPPLCRAVW